MGENPTCPKCGAEMRDWLKAGLGAYCHFCDPFYPTNARLNGKRGRDMGKRHLAFAEWRVKRAAVLARRPLPWPRMIAAAILAAGVLWLIYQLGTM
ncbi:MAG: hypothetical protein IMZ50_08735 [Candidatus Atribacteria bacterium]|nr:hypothetical protein [Candidatus Atribacteria bacterium]